MRILLVEDDPMIGQAVQDALREAAYAVDWVKDGQQVLACLKSQTYEAVLLDLGLPGRDGQLVLQDIRQRNNPVALLIISARDGLADRLQGLDGGADDYLLKPFDMDELLARLRVVLRRKGGGPTSVLSNGALALDMNTKMLRTPTEDMALSNREFALMQALLTRPGAILSRSELEERIYGWGEEVESNAVEYLIHSLRKKLGASAIKNVRGMGWMVAQSA